MHAASGTDGTCVRSIREWLRAAPPELLHRVRGASAAPAYYITRLACMQGGCSKRGRITWRVDKSAQIVFRNCRFRKFLLVTGNSIWYMTFEIFHFSVVFATGTEENKGRSKGDFDRRSYHVLHTATIESEGGAAAKNK